eukprot:CAMPEP_0113863636 /NCGR_PEP_ID=MMETSP0372-20130328/16507_1 /TAXON_ID=340204 /ORGANISM="Lankesteria abbotti" /LENGTH=126 /DNA_ID=CAMNT_0000845981 /DNA_START=355 /DNA_END=732 /DNA_ORIENTATION=- /assembly_acc=CAM_ASM_000359
MVFGHQICTKFFTKSTAWAALLCFNKAATASATLSATSAVSSEPSSKFFRKTCLVTVRTSDTLALCKYTDCAKKTSNFCPGVTASSPNGKPELCGLMSKRVAPHRAQRPTTNTIKTLVNIANNFNK